MSYNDEREVARLYTAPAFASTTDKLNTAIALARSPPAN